MALTSITTTGTTSTALTSLSTTTSTSLLSTPLKTLSNNNNAPIQMHNTGNYLFMSPTINHIESSLSPKDIVIQLRQLSQDPHQQIHLINNTDSLRILSDTLYETTQRSSIETAVISLQTLQLLAANPNYRSTLKSIPNLLQRINALCHSKHQRLQVLAKNLEETITSRIPLNKFQQYQPRKLHKIEFTVC